MTPHISTEPVPAAGAVHGIDSEYIVPAPPEPEVAAIALLCSMIGNAVLPLPGVFCTLGGSEVPQVPACMAEALPAPVADTVAS